MVSIDTSWKASIFSHGLSETVLGYTSDEKILDKFLRDLLNLDAVLHDDYLNIII